MKKLFLLIFIFLTSFQSSFAKDLTCENIESLKSKKHFAIMNPFAENLAEKVIKKTLNKETKGNYKVKFGAYTLSSLKKGIFKHLEIKGKDLEIEGVKVPYLEIISESDFNWIDYRQKPIKFRSDMIFYYKIHFSEESINSALNHEKYKQNIEKINTLAYPLFLMQDVDIKIKNNRANIIMYYTLPLSSPNKKREFAVSTDFKVENGKIRAKSLALDKKYGTISLDKVTNLINLIDPLSFTMNLIDKQKCNGKIQDVKIEDDIIKINGKIFVKGE